MSRWSPRHAARAALLGISHPLLLLSSLQGADLPLSVAAIFTDHAILQRQVAVPVWGTATPQQRVRVQFGGQQQETLADDHGQWRVVLDPMEGASEGRELRVDSGDKTVALQDILVGEIWLCAGQSNMEWPLKNAPAADAVIAKADHPTIRQFKAKPVSAEKPATSVDGAWVPCTPGTAGAFTAVGYYFATDLQAKIGGVPIGLINCSWGSTRIQAWMSPDALADFPQVGASWEKLLKDLPERQSKYEKERAEYRAQAKAAKERGEIFKKPFPKPPAGPGTREAPSGAFLGMVAPLAPYAIRGILWYQGEGNTGSAESYAKMFPRLIKDWRTVWNDTSLPFLFVQLPNYNLPSDRTGERWARLREAQMTALTLPHTGAAITIDLGTPEDGHPPDKSGFGQRLARIASHTVYRMGTGDASGPRPAEAKLTEDGIEIVFAHASSGLEVLTEELVGFEVAGLEGNYFPASAVLRGDRVILRPGPELPSRPASVRYGWNNNPKASLYNRNRLPASPFELHLEKHAGQSGLPFGKDEK